MLAQLFVGQDVLNCHAARLGESGDGGKLQNGSANLRVRSSAFTRLPEPPKGGTPNLNCPFAKRARVCLVANVVNAEAKLQKLLREVRACTVCAGHLPFTPQPVLRASSTARLLIVGQAPGMKVQQTGIHGEVSLPDDLPASMTQDEVRKFGIHGEVSLPHWNP